MSRLNDKEFVENGHVVSVRCPGCRQRTLVIHPGNKCWCRNPECSYGFRMSQGTPQESAARRYYRRQLENEVLELRAALRQIKNERRPQVCEEFELCRHAGCRASVEAFFIADKALRGEEGA